MHLCERSTGLSNQLFYEYASEMAGCPKQNQHSGLKHAPNIKKEGEKSSDCSVYILAVLYILCSCEFMMLYLSKICVRISQWESKLGGHFRF